MKSDIRAASAICRGEPTKSDDGFVVVSGGDNSGDDDIVVTTPAGGDKNTFIDRNPFLSQFVAGQQQMK